MRMVQLEEVTALTQVLVPPMRACLCGGGQVRMLLFLGSLCNGVLEALANVERCVLAALATPSPR